MTWPAAQMKENDHGQHESSHWQHSEQVPPVGGMADKAKMPTFQPSPTVRSYRETIIC